MVKTLICKLGVPPLSRLIQLGLTTNKPI
jgi:hypothetical protein